MTSQKQMESALSMTAYDVHMAAANGLNFPSTAKDHTFKNLLRTPVKNTGHQITTEKLNHSSRPNTDNDDDDEDEKLGSYIFTTEESSGEMTQNMQNQLVLYRSVSVRAKI